MPLNPEEEILLIPGEYRVAMITGGAFVVGLPAFLIAPLAIKVAQKMSFAWSNLNILLTIIALCVCAILIAASKIIWKLAFTNHLRNRTRVVVACRIATVAGLAFVGLFLAIFSVLCVTLFNQPLVSMFVLLSAPTSLFFIPSKSKWQNMVLQYKSA